MYCTCRWNGSQHAVNYPDIGSESRFLPTQHAFDAPVKGCLATQLNSTQLDVELSCVAIDTSPTQHNSTRRRVELCRYKHPFRGLPVGILPCRLLRKNMNRLATQWWKIVNICLFVLTQSTKVTDRHTDRHTYRHRMTANAARQKQNARLRLGLYSFVNLTWCPRVLELHSVKKAEKSNALKLWTIR